MSAALLEQRIAEWRAALARSAAVSPDDADELEGHLRDRVAELEAAGLDAEEAFLIGVRRLGATDRITAEFAREHGDRLWKQLVLPAVERDRRPFLEMIAFAALAIVVVQVARVIAESGEPGTAGWFVRNLAFLTLPVLGAYFVRVRRVPARVAGLLAAGVAALAVVVNLYPYGTGSGDDLLVLGASQGQTSTLVAGHLVVALWFVVLVAYLGGDRWSPTRRMDAVRFTGEWAIYYVLIALGGGVLLALTALVLAPIAPDAIPAMLSWVLPSGAVAATIVAAWLVESKKSIVENLAPVLTAIFTPLFAAGLAAAAVLYLVSGIGREFDRELLAGFDALLIVVVGLVLYGLSARDPLAPGRVMDVVRLVAVIAAVVLDVLVLGSMLARIGEFGPTPNRVAALGVNVLLVVDLAVTAGLGLRGPANVATGRMARWQTLFLPVFALWALAVVVVLPPVFGFA